MTCLLKAHSDPISRICAGRLFHSVGAAAENELVPKVALKLPLGMFTIYAHAYDSCTSGTCFACVRREASGLGPETAHEQSVAFRVAYLS